MLQLLEKTTLQEAEYNADQTELRALKYGISHFDAGIEDDNIAGSLDDYEPHDLNLEDWAISDATKDNAVGDIIETLKARSHLLGDAYPFKINKQSISLKAEHPNVVYLYCLAVANSPNITTGEFVKLPRLFERMAGEISINLLGSNANWMHTGWPRSQGLPPKFKDLVAEIKHHTFSKYEWSWKPQEGYADDDAKRIKDGGIDFLVWKDFSDSRDGRLFVAGQCACGNDWVNKFSDIQMKKLASWIHPTSWIPPVKLLAIPFCTVEEYINECSMQDSLLIDRIRLTNLYTTSGTELSVEEDMRVLIKFVLEQIM